MYLWICATHTYLLIKPSHPLQRATFPRTILRCSVLLRQSWETGKANKVAAIGSPIPHSVYDLSLFDSRSTDTLAGSLHFYVEAGQIFS